MTEIEALTEEEYAYYLAFGDLESVCVNMQQQGDYLYQST